VVEGVTGDEGIVLGRNVDEAEPSDLKAVSLNGLFHAKRFEAADPIGN
jgi:hypothetical protein